MVLPRANMLFLLCKAHLCAMDPFISLEPLYLGTVPNFTPDEVLQTIEFITCRKFNFRISQMNNPTVDITQIEKKLQTVPLYIGYM